MGIPLIRILEVGVDVRGEVLQGLAAGLVARDVMPIDLLVALLEVGVDAPEVVDGQTRLSAVDSDTLFVVPIVEHPGLAQHLVGPHHRVLQRLGATEEMFLLVVGLTHRKMNGSTAVASESRRRLKMRDLVQRNFTFSCI